MSETYETTLFTDNPWPSSDYRRPSPGLAVKGRSWANIMPEYMEILIGDILRDAVSYTIELAIRCTKNTAGEMVISATINSTTEVPMDLDAQSRFIFVEYLQFMLDKNNYLGKDEFADTFYVHGSGFFWQEPPPPRVVKGQA